MGGMDLAAPKSPSEIEVKPYSAENREAWDELVRHSRNGTFLFLRDYLEYHSDRFEDASLVLSYEGEVRGVFVANRIENRIVAHSGLTYGGLVVSKKVKAIEAAHCMQAALQYYEKNARELSYKPVPDFFHAHPLHEDQIQIVQMGGRLEKFESGWVVDFSKDLPLQQRRMRSAKKAEKSGIEIKKTDDLRSFWERVLVPHLGAKFETQPVHSYEEIQRLNDKLKGCFELWAAFELRDGAQEMVAGTLLYVFEPALHAQYIASTEQGRQSGAIDLLFSRLLVEAKNRKCHYFSLGTATQEDGLYGLNSGLVEWKEGWGAESHPYLRYLLPLKK